MIKRIFFNENDIRDYYNYLTNKYNKIGVDIRFVKNSGFHGRLLENNTIELSDKLLTDRINNYKISNKFTSYYNNHNLIHLSDYVIIHEIFHYISGLMDGLNFEYQLDIFIKEQLDILKRDQK